MKFMHQEFNRAYLGVTGLFDPIQFVGKEIRLKAKALIT